MFDHSMVSTIKDTQFANRDIHNHTHTNDTRPVLEILYEKAAPGGFHISEERYDPPKCHEDTRTTVRQDLLDQVKIAVVSCIIWLYGAAGAGKSAIAQSFAETCQREGLLIGTFFFFRAAPLRNNARCLAASLAYQLGRAVPATRQYMSECITTDPAIFSSSLEDQLDKLFVEPLYRACKNDPTLKPVQRLVILDGLDECDTPNVQRNIITVLEKATPIPIVILVASRPEIHISSTFEALDRRRAPITTFHVGLNDKYNVNGDICLYLNDKFKEIKRDHPFKKYLPEVWPLPDAVESIIQKSSGQFIYAATIIRYIGHLQCNPHERLQTALNASQHFVSTSRDSPFKELDALYSQIFSGVENLMTTLSILYLALNVNGDRAQRPRTIAYRLGVDSSAVEIYISDLASLMKYEGENTPIRFFHASLEDFLVDKHRSQKLYIKQSAVHTALSKAYMCHFLRSVPSYHQLDSSLAHLCLSELDPELRHLVENVESHILGILKALQPKNMVLKSWTDHTFHQPFSIFSAFVQTIYDIKENLARYTQNNGFWDQCVGALHEVFRTQLSVYLADSNTKDFLAIVALANMNIFPQRHFSSSLGISESVLTECCEVNLFESSGSGPAPFHGTALQILQKFLLDRELSGKLYISSEQCSRAAMKCLGVIKDARFLKEVPGSEDKIAYLCAIRGLTATLLRASHCQQLIDALDGFNRHPQWLTNGHPKTRDAEEAIRLYLKTHSSKSPPGGVIDPKEPVQAVDELSIGQRVRKRARVTSNNGDHVAMEGSAVEASRSSGRQGAKKRKVKKT